MAKKERSWALTRARVLLLLGLLAVAIALVWQLVPRDETSSVALSDELARFRKLAEQDPARTEAAAGLPAPGVYRYAIQGGESLDALLDADHPYGGTATIVVTRVPCGVEESWRVLRERWSVSALCQVGGELRLRRLDDYHDFFGEARTYAYACAPSARPRVTECRAGGSGISYSTQSLGTEPVEVGGRTFVARHIRSAIVLSGETSGAGRSEEWRRSSDGLLLRKRVEVSTNVAVPGGGEYTESYWLALRSSRPER
ncbi:MAG TPA: hypothetical protein VFX45_00560 [Solirubrobacterales bacterium]|nr:hypothetical protein [Solirubrobacterales bacterium]